MVTEACNDRIVTFHSDVYPQNKELIKELQLRTPPRFSSWGWYFADAPFLLAARPLWRWIGESAVIWYIEWDVAWTGNLGSIFTELRRTSCTLLNDISEKIPACPTLGCGR